MNYTTIEQSKKLKELGLSLTTADAFYDKVFGIVVPSKPCTNPQMDCINCPRVSSGVYTTHTDIDILENTNKE